MKGLINMENVQLTAEQMEQQLQATQAVADQLAQRLGENEKYIAQLSVANQIAQNRIKQLEEENAQLKDNGGTTNDNA